MPIELIIFLLVIGFLSLLKILSMVRKRKLMLRHAISWGFLIVMAMVVTLLIDPLSRVAAFIGIEEVSNMIFFGGFLLLLTITFVLTISVSKQKEDLVKLTQNLAITNHKLREIDNESNKKSRHTS